MGSGSDMEVMQKAVDLLKDFGIDSQVEVASAHRTPQKVLALVKSAEKDCDAIIAGAGMAAHLPGVVAAYTTLPVIGVPLESKALAGFDALYSIVQMPPGVPVACVAIGGAKNAAILAAQMLSLKHPQIKQQLKKLKQEMAKGKKI